ncbi:MAG: ABATE domain-containing protein [Hyphomicrobium sp.]|jgi:predicted RNA-binding Zn ribbon-like protein
MTNHSSSRPHPDAPQAQRPAAFRIGDHVALDFLNTVVAPRGEAVEWISNGTDLLDWLIGAGALDAAESRQLTSLWSTARIDRTAAEAVELREWFRSVVARIDHETGAVVSRDTIKRLNALLLRDAAYSHISATDPEGHREIVLQRHWSDPGQLLVPIAAAMADLICHGEWQLIRRCENPACTIWFYDRTKGHRRRWCSQTMCGNRAKVAAFRERQRQDN